MTATEPLAPPWTSPAEWRRHVAGLPADHGLRTRHPDGRYRPRSPLTLTPGERAVALHLADVTDATGCAAPGVIALAVATGYHPATCSRALRRLEAVGLVVQLRRRGRPLAWRLTLPAPQTSADPADAA